MAWALNKKKRKAMTYCIYLKMPIFSHLFVWVGYIGKHAGHAGRQYRKQQQLTIHLTFWYGSQAKQQQKQLQQQQQQPQPHSASVVMVLPHASLYQITMHTPVTDVIGGDICLLFTLSLSSLINSITAPSLLNTQSRICHIRAGNKLIIF